MPNMKHGRQDYGKGGFMRDFLRLRIYFYIGLGALSFIYLLFTPWGFYFWFSVIPLLLLSSPIIALLALISFLTRD